MRRPSSYYKVYWYKGWGYFYQTERNSSDQDWMAWAEKPGAREHAKERVFKTRAAAKRCALRWQEAHIRRNERAKKLRTEGYIPPGSLCPKCEESRTLKGDYLCRKCRLG